MVSTLVETLTWDKSEDQSYFHNTHDQTLDIVERVSKGLPPKTSPRDALETMRLCFAAEQSSNTGKLVTLN
jgi:predicted dehydrogenase